MTRWYLLLAGVVTLGFAGYSMLRINRVVELKGVEHVWEVMLQRDAVFVRFTAIYTIACRVTTGRGTVCARNAS